MTTAEKIAAHLNGSSWSAITLTYGYAMSYGGTRVSFETAKVVSDKRTPAGRLIEFIGEYDDGSRILMKWNERDGLRISAIKGRDGVR